MAREHTKLCTEIINGKYYTNIDKDPRDTTTADEKIDLKTLGHFRKTFATQQTMLPGDNIRVKTASKGVDKYCVKMKEWLYRVRASIAERKAAAEKTQAAPAEVAVEKTVAAPAEEVKETAPAALAEPVKEEATTPAAPVEAPTVQIPAAPAKETPLAAPAAEMKAVEVVTPAAAP